MLYAMIARHNYCWASNSHPVRAKSAQKWASYRIKMPGCGRHTLQEWEQGRRSPTGAAKTLLRVAEIHPEILRELAAG